MPEHLMPGVQMRQADVDYARDIFAELVVALSLQSSNALSSSESEALAEKALNLAKSFSAAQLRGASGARPELTVVEAPQRHEPLGASGPTFAQVVETWLQRAVKRTAGRSRRALRSVLARYVLPHLGARPIEEI